MKADSDSLDLSASPSFLHALGIQLAQQYGRGEVSDALASALKLAFSDAVFFSLQLFLSPGILVSQRNMCYKGRCTVDLLATSKSLAGTVGRSGQVIVHPLGDRHGQMTDLEDLRLSWQQLDNGSGSQGMPMVVCCPLIWSTDWEAVLAGASAPPPDGVPKCEDLLRKLKETAVCNPLGSITIAVNVKDADQLDRIMTNLVLSSAAIAPFITYEAQQLLEDMGMVANITAFGKEYQYVPGTGWKQCSNEPPDTDDVSNTNSGSSHPKSGANSKNCIPDKSSKPTCKTVSHAAKKDRRRDAESDEDASPVVGSVEPAAEGSQQPHVMGSSSEPTVGQGEELADEEGTGKSAITRELVEEVGQEGPSQLVAVPQHELGHHPVWMYFLNSMEENRFAERTAQQLSQFDRSFSILNIGMVSAALLTHSDWTAVESGAEIFQVALLWYCVRCAWWSSSRRDLYLSSLAVATFFTRMYLTFPAMWRANVDFMPFGVGGAVVTMPILQVRFPYLCGLLIIHLLIFILSIHPNHCAILKPSMDCWSCRGALMLMTSMATLGSCGMSFVLERSRRKSYIAGRMAGTA